MAKQKAWATVTLAEGGSTNTLSIQTGGVEAVLTGPFQVSVAYFAIPGERDIYMKPTPLDGIVIVNTQLVYESGHQIQTPLADDIYYVNRFPEKSTLAQVTGRFWDAARDCKINDKMLSGSSTLLNIYWEHAVSPAPYPPPLIFVATGNCLRSGLLVGLTVALTDEAPLGSFMMAIATL